MAGREGGSIQLKVSQLDNNQGDGNLAVTAVDHDPWPTSAKKHANIHNTPRKGRRQSALVQEFKTQAASESHDQAAANDSEESTELARDFGSGQRGRRRSSARRGSIQEQTVECRAKRRRSLLPVLRAASKGEEVEVIDGIKSTEILEKGTSRGTTASAQKEKRRSFHALTEGDEVKKEPSESVVSSPVDVSSSVSNMKRRSRSSSLKEGVASEVSQELSMSGKLEDQINLQHLVELMRVFSVSQPFSSLYDYNIHLSFNW